MSLHLFISLRDGRGRPDYYFPERIICMNWCQVVHGKTSLGLICFEFILNIYLK